MRSEQNAAATPPLFRFAYPIRVTRIVAAAAVFFFAGCGVQPPTASVQNIDRLLVLIQQRLDYMDDVARNKWNSGAVIEDLPRERVIIQAIGREAPAYRLNPEIAKDFFRAQIEASKLIQNARFAQWRAGNQPKFTNTADLQNHIRPALDALTPAMLRALAEAMPALQSPGAATAIEALAKTTLSGTPADAPARATAIEPLKRIAGKR